MDEDSQCGGEVHWHQDASRTEGNELSDLFVKLIIGSNTELFISFEDICLTICHCWTVAVRAEIPFWPCLFSMKAGAGSGATQEAVWAILMNSPHQSDE